MFEATRQYCGMDEKWNLDQTKDFGEGSASNAGFPNQPEWFEDARGFDNLEKGLEKVGFNEKKEIIFLVIIGIISIKNLINEDSSANR